MTRRSVFALSYYSGAFVILCIQQIGVRPLAANFIRFHSVSSFSNYGPELHKELQKNQVPFHPPRAPYNSDPAISDVRVQQRICEDILSNGFLYASNLIPLDPTDVYLHRDDPKYSDIFHQIYDLRTYSPDSDYENTNSYRQETFQFLSTASTYTFQEDVFVCPVKRASTDEGSVEFYFVSKQYERQDPWTELSKPIRFVFGNFLPKADGNVYNFETLMLAEEPAKVYANRRYHPFDVESYYLKIRKNASPVAHSGFDPLCRLIMLEFDQYNRTCMAVCTSYFLRYAQQVFVPCTEEEVFFRRSHGVQLEGKSYREHMTICRCNHIHPGVRTLDLHISRAYKSNELLIYSRDPSNEKLYLENLIVNLSIVDEINSFDFPEKRRRRR